MKGVLHEKNGDGYSAGRVIAIGFALVFAFRLIWVTVLGMALGWPDAWLGFAIVFAVPIHRMLSGARGHELVKVFLERLGTGAVGANAAPEAAKAGMELIRRGLDNRFTDDERGEP